MKKLRIIAICVCMTLLLLLPSYGATSGTTANSNSVPIIQTGSFELHVSDITHKVIDLDPKFKNHKFNITLSVTSVSGGGHFLGDYTCALDDLVPDNYTLACFSVYAYITSYDVNFNNKSMEDQHTGEMTVSWIATADD